MSQRRLPIPGEPVDINTLLRMLIGHPVYDLVEERFQSAFHTTEVLGILPVSGYLSRPIKRSLHFFYKQLQIILQIWNVMHCDFCIFPRTGNMNLD